MSAPLDFIAAPAVIEWTIEEVTRHLSEPVPPGAMMTFEGRFSRNVEPSFFQLHVPVSLKGVQPKTKLLLRIYPGSIVSLHSETFPETPQIVQQKLKCSSICLRFRLRCPVQVVVPLAATLPLQPKRAGTGNVIDALRSLSSAKALRIYVPDTELPKAKLQAIQEVLQHSISQAHPLAPVDDFRTLFDGTGGKIALLNDCPPSYHQIEPPPPLVPFTELNDHKKRRRHASPTRDKSADDSRFDAIWAELDKMRKNDEGRIQQLEKQVQQLTKDKEELMDRLGKDKEELLDELKTLHASYATISDAKESLECELLSFQERFDELQEQVDFINENGVDEDIKDRVAESLADRILGQFSPEDYNITFTKRRP